MLAGDVMTREVISVASDPSAMQAGAQYPAHGPWPAILLVAIASCLTGQSALAQQSPQAQRGLTILRAHCEQCHAIDKVGESPLAIAPPFRTLHLKYPVSDLQRPLIQGIHPMMPRFQLEASQVEDIMAHLRTLEP